MTTIRVLIVDDHPLFREGLNGLLATIEDIEVLDSVGDGETAVQRAVELRPDVVLMDLNLPGMPGLEAIRRITRTVPPAAVLVLTMVDDDDSVTAALRVGARGYLLKGAGPAEVVHAIHAVGSGAAVFGQSIAQRVLDYFARPTASDAFADLTNREREILGMLADGHPNARIAERLHLSPKTVRNHVSSIFAKLHVADRAEAMLRARRAGLGH